MNLVTFYLYDSGVPLHPRPPWNYTLTFNIERLTNEYFGTTLFLRDGKIFESSCFEEYELVEIPEPFGKLEAFTTTRDTSTMPWTYAGTLRTFRNKTLRWPGHCVAMEGFQRRGAD